MKNAKLIKSTNSNFNKIWGHMLSLLWTSYERARHKLWMRWAWTFLVFLAPCEWVRHKLWKR
jgi:hypothetical protein